MNKNKKGFYFFIYKKIQVLLVNEILFGREGDIIEIDIYI